MSSLFNTKYPLTFLISRYLVSISAYSILVKKLCIGISNKSSFLGGPTFHETTKRLIEIFLISE